MLAGDGVEGVQPLFRAREVCGATQWPGLVAHGGGQTAHGDFGVDVGAGSGDDVQTLLFSDGE